MIPMVLNLYLELLEDTSQLFKKVYIYEQSKNSNSIKTIE